MKYSTSGTSFSSRLVNREASKPGAPTKGLLAPIKPMQLMPTAGQRSHCHYAKPAFVGHMDTVTLNQILGTCQPAKA